MDHVRLNSSIHGITLIRTWPLRQSSLLHAKRQEVCLRHRQLLNPSAFHKHINSRPCVLFHRKISTLGRRIGVLVTQRSGMPSMAVSGCSFLEHRRLPEPCQTIPTRRTALGFISLDTGSRQYQALDDSVSPSRLRRGRCRQGKALATV